MGGSECRRDVIGLRALLFSLLVREGGIRLPLVASAANVQDVKLLAAGEAVEGGDAKRTPSGYRPHRRGVPC